MATNQTKVLVWPYIRAKKSWRHVLALISLICSQKTLQTFLGFSATHSRLELIKSMAVPFISSNLLCIHLITYLVSHSCISPNAVQSHIFGYDEAKKATVISSDTFKTRSKSFKVNRIKCVADFISVFTVWCCNSDAFQELWRYFCQDCYDVLQGKWSWNWWRSEWHCRWWRGRFYWRCRTQKEKHPGYHESQAFARKTMCPNWATDHRQW